MFLSSRTNQTGTVQTLPLLPLRDVVVFPHAPAVSLIVGRERSLNALRASLDKGRLLFLVAQRRAEQEDPGPEELYAYGTIAHVEETLSLPDGTTRMVVSGRSRGRLSRFCPNATHFEVEVEALLPDQDVSVELQALVRTVKGSFERFVKLNRNVPPEMLLAVNAMEDADKLADTLVPVLRFKLAERQELLELVSPDARLERVYRALVSEIEFLQVEKKLKGKVARERENAGRDQWLSEQMQAIQRELGDKGDGRGELAELADALAAKALPDDVRARAEKELQRLSQMNLISAEATVLRNYLDWILALPWVPSEVGSPSLAKAAQVLDQDHFGLIKVKERILEYLAVSTLVERMRGPILCLVGPPGVGKTSLARSIARATDRPFVRISLGGVRDEAEIRGHRRTYIGAMPGKLIQAMKRAERLEPVLLLDEIDKMSSDFRGDPASALLEVLDPEQNSTFSDHYLDEDYDLSRTLFICTANTLQGIPPALADRLEVIELTSYTEREKVVIAKTYLLPKQLELNGLEETAVVIPDEVFREIVRSYTKESGVRGLEREVATICRKVARQRVAERPEPVEMDEEQPTAPPRGVVTLQVGDVKEYLGVKRFSIKTREEQDHVGLVKGMAVSPWGGELLDIEVATVPGKGKLILTGRLGDWLKESAEAGFTYVRSRAAALGLDTDFHEVQDFHVHYPGNPLKTDGPSAGIAMATALVSAATGIPVRSDTAMTGEISLRGRVLPIGGVKEKLLAAHRGGVKRVILPEENRKDLEDLPAQVLESLEVICVSHVDRVLKEALSGTLAAEIFSGASIRDSAR